MTRRWSMNGVRMGNERGRDRGFSGRRAGVIVGEVGLAVLGLVIAWVMGVGLSACQSKVPGKGDKAKTSSDAKKGWHEAGAFQVQLPDEKGDYRWKGTFPKRYRCQKDADCVLTHLVPGHCCPDQCEAHAANKEWMSALRQLHYPTCREWWKRYGFGACGKPKCPPLKGLPKARCIKNRCVTAYRPIVPKVKFKTVTPPRLSGPPEKPGSAARKAGKGAVTGGAGGQGGSSGKAGPNGEAAGTGKPRPARHNRVQ